jgi:hypothetical protein
MFRITTLFRPAAIILAGALIAGCSGNDDGQTGGAPGTACQFSQQGAATCQSKICASVGCLNGNMHVCAGAPCTVGTNSCTAPFASTGGGTYSEQGYSVDGFYCLPQCS